MKFAINTSLPLLIAIFCATSALQAAPLAGRTDLEVGGASFAGYLKSYAIGLFPPEQTSLESSYQLFEAGRLNGYYRPRENLKLEAAYELQAVFQGGSAAKQQGSAGSLGTSLPLTEGTTYRLFDFPTEIGGDRSGRTTRFFENLDRAVAYWDLPQADITLGRQAITFGSARAIQATDVLLPYSFQQLSTEYRIGVDALRAQLPLSQLSELDLGIVLGKDARAENSAGFIRVQTSVVETDVIGIGLLFSGAKLLGGGVQRSIWDLGYSLDFAQVWADRDESYFRLSTSLDYSFESGLILFGEYHFNGAGASSAAEYPLLLGSFALQKGGVFLLGRHYLIPGMSYPITPLLNAQAQALINAQDGSVYFSSGLEYGATESLYFDLGLALALGKGPLETGLRSEFGSYPVQAYGAARVYF